MKICKACNNYLGEINSKYPKSKHLQFIKITNWITPCIIKGTPILEAATFCTDANKLGIAGYKSENMSQVIQSAYILVQKSELYAIVMVLLDFSESLNIFTLNMQLFCI